MSHYCQAYRSVGLFFFFIVVTSLSTWSGDIWCFWGCPSFFLWELNAESRRERRWLSAGLSIVRARAKCAVAPGGMPAAPQALPSLHMGLPSPPVGSSSPPPNTRFWMITHTRWAAVWSRQVQRPSCLLFNVKKEIPGLWSWYQFLFVFCNA